MARVIRSSRSGSRSPRAALGFELGILGRERQDPEGEWIDDFDRPTEAAEDEQAASRIQSTL
jgi:hypothetical protein